MRKAEIAILEKIFTAEINEQLPCQLHDSKALRALIDDGCAEPDEVVLGRRFSTTIKGYCLTYRGGILYCEWDQPED